MLAAIMVKKRCVLYFCGFDPSGPAHYHRLYREQAALQSKVSGATINVGARQNLAKEISKWDIQYASGNESVHTDYHFMRWDDVVRQHWKPSGVQVAWQTLTANAEYISNGALWAMFRLAWPPSIAIFSPAVLLVFLLLFAPILSLKISHELHWIAGLGFFGSMLVLAWLAEENSICNG
ncbi:MAG: hypothetical protein HC765_10720 [Brachymonas sp.]|nr:hypothetical protein [Brachymonas sp.]